MNHPSSGKSLFARSSFSEPAHYRSGRGTRLRLVCVAAAVLTLSTWLQGQPAPGQLLSFQTFMANTNVAAPADYMAQPDSRVRDAAAFEEMRRHILGLYDGVKVTHSFLLAGHAFDCIPIEQQVSLHRYGQDKIASPPPATPRGKQDRGEDAPVAASQVAFGAVDSF